MMNKIEEKIKRMELKYKFIKDQIKQELFFEFAKKLKKGYRDHFEVDKFEKYKYALQSLQTWFELIIEEYEKGYDSGYKTELDELRDYIYTFAKTTTTEILKQQTEINELKERQESFSELFEETRLTHLYRIVNNEEVLRELNKTIVKIICYLRDKSEIVRVEIGNKWILTLNLLLEMLDVGKTEKKELIGIKHDPEYLDQFTTEDSGGEKDSNALSELGESPINVYSHEIEVDDSKPPEPSIIKVISDEELEQREASIIFPKESGEHKRIEPRENEKENMMFATFDKRTHILVKREALMKMIAELRYTFYGYDKEEWFTSIEKQIGYDYREDLEKIKKDREGLGSKNTVALTHHRKRATSLTDESPDESPDDSPDLKLPESRIIDSMTNDEFENLLNQVRNAPVDRAIDRLKGIILRERRLSKKETISKVVEKIESMRVKFADATKNYTTMDLMNELWEYKRELEKKVK